MKIQVLGSGCPTCQKLHQLVKEVVAQEKIEAEIEYLSGSEGIQKIMELEVMSSPVLVIDDQVAATGLITKEQLIQEFNKLN